jgi:hypothetical protein
VGTLLIDDPVQTDDLLSFDRISSGWGSGAAWDQAWATNPTTAMSHMAQEAGTGANATGDLPIQGMMRITGDAVPMMTPDQAEERYGIPGQLSFKGPEFSQGVREAQAKLLKTWKQDEIRRSDILARSTPGFAPATARFAVGLGASVLDPINVASAFIPVLGEARFAALAGKAGLTGARAARGALEGVVGAAAVEPLILLQARSEQADYDAYDSLLNVTFGALVGAGLHTGGGFVKDRIVGKPDLRPRVDVEPSPAVTAETHDAALRGAVAAVAEGRPVEVADFVRLSSRRETLLSGTSLARTAPPVAAADPALPRAPAEEAAARRVADVEARAREIDPDTFRAFEARQTEKATYSRWIEDLAATRQKNAEELVADLDRQIAEQQARLDGAPNQRKAKTYQKRLDELTAERDSRVKEATTGDTPDMAKVRRKLLEADEAMRDLAPAVSAAKRRADADTPNGVDQVSGLYDVTGPLDQEYPRPIAAETTSFDQAWEQIRTSQRNSSPVQPSDTAALSAADVKAKDYAKPATIETESKALSEWAASDSELVDGQRQAGNLDEKDETLLEQGGVAEKQHLDRANGLEALAQCLIG